MANWSKNADIVLKERYLKRSSDGQLLETNDGMLHRVAEAIAKAEPETEQAKMTERYFKLLDSLVFLPNSPTLMNAGRDLGQLSGCFALPIEDDISAIFEAVKQSAIIHKSGGGTGFSFSKIRPSGSVVKSTSGVASGPISFMKVFNAATEVVKQGGKRRGANLGVLICTHPDIVKWINCKTTPGEFENFNISVALTDDFIKAAISGSDFGLLDPCKKTNGLKINAAEVFALICHNSWVSGEPGVLFIDTINKMNPCPQLGKIETTNPCIVGDSIIAVADGRLGVSIRQLVLEGKEVPVYCSDKEGWMHIRMGRNPRLTQKNAEILKVVLDDGSSLRVTKNHRFELNDGSEKRADQLISGDSLRRFDRYQFTYQGKKTKYWGIQHARRNVYQEHRLMAEYELERELSKSEVIHHEDHNGLNNVKKNRKLVTVTEHSAIHDISGDNNPMRRFPEKNPWNNVEWQRLNREKHRVGVPLRQETKVKISQKARERWEDEDYREMHHEATMKGVRRYQNHKVVSVEFDGVEDVYNITVDDFHTYCVITDFSEDHQSGVVVHNCGEVPLYSYESCNLGSIDLSKFVKDGDFQWNRLEKTLRLCVRFLDDVIDVNRYPKVRIENKTKLTRKIGLGVMGWADALIELNIKYDSAEALNMADKVMKFVKDVSHDESRRLAKERGPYEALVKGKPLMRNASLTTIAPTGTLSLIANCSSSIEPLFSKNYTKTVMDDVVLDLSKEYSHPEAIITAHDVSPEAHVRMQAAFQVHVDNAVSKTINLPNEATEEDIKNAILLGYELGCKGMTLYRDGTRDAPLKKTEHGLSECENGKCDIF
jgi:ribonucleoside-diphosphate reductase alpha chain